MFDVEFRRAAVWPWIMDSLAVQPFANPWVAHLRTPIPKTTCDCHEDGHSALELELDLSWSTFDQDIT